MSPELDKKLCETYPLIFKDRRGDMRQTAMCWGFEVGDGWYSLIDTLCALIYRPYEQACEDYRYLRGVEEYPGGKVVSAVAVERARQAMEDAAKAIPVAVQVKEKFGTLRFYVRGVHSRSEAIRNYIEFAEYFSSRICEVCGAPGKLRGGGWVQTLCDEHAHEAEGRLGVPQKA